MSLSEELGWLQTPTCACECGSCMKSVQDYDCVCIDCGMSCPQTEVDCDADSPAIQWRAVGTSGVFEQQRDAAVAWVMSRCAEETLPGRIRLERFKSKGGISVPSGFVDFELTRSVLSGLGLVEEV